MTLRWRESAVACGLLLLLVVAAHFNVVFLGRSLVYTDNYNPLDYRLLAQNYGPHLVPANVWNSRNLLPYANFHDPGATWWQWEPGGEFLRRALQRGEWPWWDPYVGGGAPAMSNLTQAFFFPPYLLLVALGNGAVLKNVYFLTILLTAGFFTYLVLRQHHVSREASFAGAAAVLFCGGLNQNIGSFIGQTAACLPPALFLTCYFLDRPSWRRAALLATGYAALALASFPALLVAAFGLSALYAAVLIATGEDRVQTGVRYLAAVALAVGLVAFYYLPAIAAMREAPQIDRVYRGAGAQSIPWVCFSQLLSPVLMDATKVFADAPMRSIGTTSLPYIGVVALLIAGLAGPIGTGQIRSFFLVLAIGALLITLKLAGVEPVQSLGRLPGLRSVHFGYFGIPLNIVIALGVGLGLERLLAGRASRARVWLVSSGLGTVALAMPAVALVRGTFAHSQAMSWLARWYLLVALLVITTGILLALAGRRESSTLRRRVVTGAVLGLLVIEGLINTSYPRQVRWDVWRHPPPYVRELVARRHAGRIYTASALNANAASAFELFQLDSLMTFNSPRMFELYKRYAAPNAYLFLREASLLPPERVLDAANVGLLAIRDAHSALQAEAENRGYKAVFADGYVRLFERDTEPRYYFTSHYRRLPREQALTAVAERRSPREILLEAEPAFPSAPNDGSEPAVVVRAFARNRVVLWVQAARPGLVYSSESFFPGWRAVVNGHSAPILVANYAFRAVPVPAGDVTVELSYYPPALSAGLVMTLVAGLLVALLALWPQKPAAPEQSTTRRRT